MITCMKHKTNFIKGECPTCKKEKEAVHYSTDSPEHNSEYMLKQTNRLKDLTTEIRKINDKLKGLLKENECKKD